MLAIRGLTIAFGVFAASFALHVVAGATGQGWLFAIAVALIFASAAGFPVIAAWFAGRGSRTVLAAGSIAGAVLTGSALWAANGRAFAWWEPPLACALVILGSGAMLAAARILDARGAFSRAAPEAR